MKTPHTFATKQADKLSLAWLDECFQAFENKANELEDRIKMMGAASAVQGETIIQLQDQIKRLQPKPVPPKVKTKLKATNGKAKR